MAPWLSAKASAWSPRAPLWMSFRGQLELAGPGADPPMSPSSFQALFLNLSRQSSLSDQPCSVTSAAKTYWPHA